MKAKLYSTDVEEAISVMMDLQCGQGNQVGGRFTRCGIADDDPRSGEKRLKLIARYYAIYPLNVKPRGGNSHSEINKTQRPISSEIRGNKRRYIRQRIEV